MVLYRVFQEAAPNKYYSTIFSKATLFQAVVYSLMIIPPFFIAYATNDFWHYTSVYREQPRVQYIDQVIAEIAGAQNSTMWSSFDSSSMISLGPGQEPSIVFSQSDENGDGLDDILRLTISFTNVTHDVQSIQMMLFFQVNLNRVGFLEQFPRVTLQSLTYTSGSWGAPASGVWLGGEMGLSQRDPLPASGTLNQYNQSLVNSTDTVHGGDITSILSTYSERNVRTRWDNLQAVWTSGPNPNFTAQVELRYPPFTVTYWPTFWQYLKFAWVQYLAMLVLFWWVLSCVQSFVFENQVILTVRERTDKLHCD